MIYRETNRMSDLLTQDRRAMQIVNRFGIPMGVGDKTIDTSDVTYLIAAILNK